MHKDKIKKFLMNPWTISIGAPLVVLIITSIVDAIKKQAIFTTIKTFFVKGWELIIKFLNLNIKMWVILIVIIALVLILWIISRITIAKEANKEPEFIKYTQDELLGYVWEWTWGKNYNGQYEIRDLQPICSKCGTPLFSEAFNRPFLKCVRCDEIVEWDSKKMDQVKILICDNVNKGKYKNKLMEKLKNNQDTKS